MWPTRGQLFSFCQFFQELQYPSGFLQEQTNVVWFLISKVTFLLNSNFFLINKLKMEPQI